MSSTQRRWVPLATAVVVAGLLVAPPAGSVPAADFGDAPDTYGTLLASDGARHTAGGPFLGIGRDTDSDGQPDASASGDDNAGGDDEDGVFFTGPFVPGVVATITFNASVDAVIDVFIDFNRNGTFADAADHIATSLPVMAGFSTFTFIVPPDAVTGPTFARFRLSSAGGLGPTGAAPDGEVEDYLVSVGPTAASCDSSPPAGAIVGTAGSDRITGTAGDDVIFGLGGNDDIDGAGGHDLICGGDGNDRIQGGEGNDVLVAGTGFNLLLGGGGNDVLVGGPSSDSLDGGTGTNTNDGGPGNDSCANPSTGPGCP